MLSSIPIKEKMTNSVIHQFIFPFSISRKAYDTIKQDLLLMDFIPFQLTNKSLEDRFYGPHHRISHLEMEHMFLPYANQFLFPKQIEDPLAFQRYSRELNMACEMHLDHTVLPFHVHSADVFLCPYEIGMITIRTELASSCTYSESIEFAKRFRALENLESADESSFIKTQHNTYYEMVEFFNGELVPGFFDWMDQDEQEDNTFAKLPFLINERMFTLSFYGLNAEETIMKADLFRAVRLNGFNASHEPYVGTSNSEYLESYVEERMYDRWAPNTYYIADEHVLSCVSTAPRSVELTLVNEMYGRYYYAFLLNLFHKIVLLKLSNHYGKLRLDRNRERVVDLIRGITLFSSRFYSREMAAESQLRDIFNLLRRMHSNDELLQDVKHTLTALYDYESNSTSKRSDYVLRILTVFTVISGIYGMNQVIDDLKAPVDWHKAIDYSLFEYIALSVTFLGISASIVLAMTTLWGIAKESWRNRKRQ